jgi:hypothetical protein
MHPRKKVHVFKILHIFTIYIKPLSFRRTSITNIKRSADGGKSTCLEMASPGPVSIQQFSEHDNSADEFSAEGKI